MEVVYAKIGRKNEKRGGKREMSKVRIMVVVGKADSACRE